LKTKIKSSISDNYRRIRAIDSLLEVEYELTKGKDIREKIRNNQDIDVNDENDVYYLHEESILVGLLLAWSVTTIECLVNHALAEIIDNKIISTLAIENPRKLFEGIKTKASSELSYKIILLDENSEMSKQIAVIADRIVKIRNQIVHDKPYTIDYSDMDNIQTEYYSLKDYQPQNIYVEDLTTLFSDMDKIILFVKDKTKKNSNLHEEAFLFSDLLSWK
jgi:hypothetical protein